MINIFIYVEDLFYLTLSSKGSYKLKSLDYILTYNNKLKLFNNSSFLLINNKLNKLNVISFKAILNNMIFHSQFGQVDYLYLKGIGFKVLNDSNMLLFKLNYSHYLYYALPLEMKAIVKKKNKLMKFQFNQSELARNVINKLYKFRLTNIYTQKGIFKNSQLIFKKEGKKKQI